MTTNASDTLWAIDKLGYSVADVSAILLTHWHNDHAAGTAKIADQSRCSVYCALEEKPHLLKPQQKSFRQRVSSKIPEYGPLVLAKGCIQDAVPVPIPEKYFVDVLPEGFSAVHTPGHTAGHCAYYFEPAKALFTGDALASVKNRIRLMARPVTLDIVSAKESAIKCLTLDFKIFCPGHRMPLLEISESKHSLLNKLQQEDFRWPLLG